MSRVSEFSVLTGEVKQLGEVTEDLTQLLGLGEMMATGRDDVIVFVEGPALQKWEDE